MVEDLGREWTASLIALARRDFPAASERLKLTGADGPVFREWAVQSCRNEALDNQVTVVYMLGEIGFAEVAIELANSLLAQSNEDSPDDLLISVADMYHRIGEYLPAFRFLHDRITSDRSDTFYSKCCDFARDAGLAFISESLLTEAVAYGREALLCRLIEHWYEHRDWRQIRKALSKIIPPPVDPYLNYMWGRSCVSLLLEDEMLRCLDRLWASGELGHQYASLLLDVWDWRIAERHPELRSDAGMDLPWPLAEDYRSMCAAESTGGIDARLLGRPASWRVLRPREGLPNVLGIGMQRSGTTWLWNHLFERTEVQPLPQKEVVFFSDAFRSPADVDPAFRPGGGAPADDYWQGPTRNLFRYLAHFQSGYPVRLDFSPTYAELPSETIKIVAALLGSDIRVLLCIRDPIDRAWSNLKLDLKIAGVPPSELTFANRCAHYLSNTALRRADSPSVYRSWKKQFRYLKVISYDDIVMKPDQTLSDVDDYLDLPYFRRPQASERINATEDIEMPAADRAFLLGAYGAIYTDAGRTFGQVASTWRRRHELLLAHTCSSTISGANWPS